MTARTNHDPMDPDWIRAVVLMEKTGAERKDPLLFALSQKLNGEVHRHQPNTFGCQSCRDEGCDEWDATRHVILLWLLQEAGA